MHAAGSRSVGVSAVNALSDWLELEIRRGGKVYYQKYSRGIPLDDLRQTGTTQSGERHGTKTTFHPDPEIFKNVLEFKALALLGGRDAGARGADGRFPAGSINAAIEDVLDRWAPAAKP